SQIQISILHICDTKIRQLQGSDAIKIPTQSHTRSNVCHLAELGYPPGSWNPPHRRVLELFGVGDGIAELAVFVEGTGEEVMEQAGAHLFELRNHRLRLRNRLIHRVQHRRDAGLLFRCRGRHIPFQRFCRVRSRVAVCRSSSDALKPALEHRALKKPLVEPKQYAVCLRHIRHELRGSTMPLSYWALHKNNAGNSRVQLRNKNSWLFDTDFCAANAGSDFQSRTSRFIPRRNTVVNELL